MAKNPWGREAPASRAYAAADLAESGLSCFDSFGRPIVPTPRALDFEEVGLPAADARLAVEGLARGDYLSFEDACMSRAFFRGGQGGGPLAEVRDQKIELDETLMRAKARVFAGMPREAQS